MWQRSAGGSFFTGWAPGFICYAMTLMILFELDN
jgi:hypothetical protein